MGVIVLAAPLAASASASPRSIRGTLVVVAQEDGANSFYLDQHGRMSEELSFPRPPGIKPNTPVQVTGVEKNGVLHASEIHQVGPPPAAPTTIGNKKLLVILLDWGVGLKTTPSKANAFVFGTSDIQRRSVTQYYTDVSYGQLTWSGDVTTILTIANPGGCVLNTIANSGDTAATNAGYTLSNYDNRMYVFPDPSNDCTSRARGEISGARTWIADGLADISDGYERMLPDHELGHNLGEYHAHGLECGSGIISSACIVGAKSRSCENGTGSPCVSEYGNAFGLMGNNWTSNDYDAVNWFGIWDENRLGWVNGRVATDAQPGGVANNTFTIAPIEASTGTVGLFLTTSAGHTYAIEYRQPLSQDSFLTNFPDATSGVLISRDDPVSGSDPGPIAVDTSPDSNLSPFCSDYTEYCDWFDASLNTGATYADVDGAFTLTVNSTSSSGASVTVHWAAAGGTSLGEMSTSVAYNGWGGITDGAASGGTYRVSSTKSDKATWKSPTSTSLTWVTRIGPNRGIAKVVIDGTSQASVDLYASSPAGKSFTYSGLTSKAHTVTVSVSGTKNASSSGFGVPIDAFTAGATTNQDDNAKVTYVPWKGASSTLATGGTYRSATNATARSTLTFTGTGVDWITTKGPAYGKAEVIIDGVNKGTFDLYASAVGWKSLIPFAGLSPGAHTMVVHVLGVKNPSATSTKVVVDGFTVHA